MTELGQLDARYSVAMWRSPFRRSVAVAVNTVAPERQCGMSLVSNARVVLWVLLPFFALGCSSERVTAATPDGGSVGAGSDTGTNEPPADAGATDATSDGSPTDASLVDRAVNDASAVDAAADARPDGSEPATPSELEGSWRVTAVRCNGIDANATIRAFITPPNSSTFVVSGTSSSYALQFTGCSVSLATTVAASAPGRATFTATGPWSCSSALCSASCGRTPAMPYVYDYLRTGTKLVMTSVGATPDETCAGNGMANPVEYTYALQ